MMGGTCSGSDRRVRREERGGEERGGSEMEGGRRTEDGVKREE